MRQEALSHYPDLMHAQQMNTYICTHTHARARSQTHIFVQSNTVKVDKEVDLEKIVQPLWSLKQRNGAFS